MRRLTAGCAIAFMWMWIMSTPVAAEQQYVYWSYWNASGSTWQYQQQGPASITPADGTVEGWRYGSGSTSAEGSQPPSAAPDFGAACSATPAKAGQKRIAVVIDTGSATVAPPGETPPGLSVKCAQVPTAANAVQVLAAVASVRQSGDGMVCGIAGYPVVGCSQAVSGDATATPTSSPSASPAANPASGSWMPFAAGAILIILIIIAAVLLTRRRRR